MRDQTNRKADYFDTIYAADDPFGYRSSWYEERKRQILTASLPRRRFKHGWEIGCSNGELTASLAARCEALYATDISQRAVQLARARNHASPHVRIERATHPGDWPNAKFDLIVLSEIGYYLQADELDDTVAGIKDSLAAEGLFVACHWLAPFEEAPFAGREVHDRLHHLLPMSLAYRYEDGDFLLEAWGNTHHTLAELEGLK